MASASKTIDFATSILKYFASGAPLPIIDNCYIGLLSTIPSDPSKGHGNPPYTGAEIGSCEVLPGAYRVSLTENLLTQGSLIEDTGTSSMQIANDGGEISWPLAPANFNVSGYCITTDSASTASEKYLAYELFDGTNKGRTIIAGDSIKINVNGLVIKEK